MIPILLFVLKWGMVTGFGGTSFYFLQHTIKTVHAGSEIKCCDIIRIVSIEGLIFALCVTIGIVSIYQYYVSVQSNSDKDDYSTLKE